MTKDKKNKKEKIGFVGLGLMGYGMARNILEKGWPLTVVAHKNRSRVDELCAKGASEAASLTELVEACDVIFLCVPSSPDVEEIVTGKKGIINFPKKGLVIVDTSTSYPISTVMVNEQVRAAGMLFCDAPLSRTPVQALAGKLVSLISCEHELLKRLRPIIEAYSEIVIHAGTFVSMAHHFKVINNFIALGYAAVWAEAYTSCAKGGLEPSVLHKFVSESGLNCRNFQNFSKFVLGGDADGHKFTINNCAKDMLYYTHYTDGIRMAGPVADSVYSTLKLAVANGYGDRYVPELAAAVGKINKVPMKEF